MIVDISQNFQEKERFLFIIEVCKINLKYNLLFIIIYYYYIYLF